MTQPQFVFGTVVALALASGIVTAQIAAPQRPAPTAADPGIAAAYLPELAVRCADERGWVLAEARTSGMLQALALEALEICIWREARTAAPADPLRAGR